jgi:hypothetical protein
MVDQIDQQTRGHAVTTSTLPTHPPIDQVATATLHALSTGADPGRLPDHF